MPDLKTLYMRRNVKNAPDIIAWAKNQGFKSALAPGKMHVTLAFSKKPVDHSLLSSSPESKAVQSGGRKVAQLGDEGAVVLHIADAGLEARHKEIHDQTGAEWSHDGYRPHITLTYQPGDIDLSTVQPYDGPIELGPEIVQEVNPKWIDTITEKGNPMTEKADCMGDVHVPAADGKKRKTFKDYWAIQQEAKSKQEKARLPVGEATIIKYSEEQRCVTGWASVVEQDGKPVVDHQGDVMSEADLLKSAHNFMADYRVGKAMHQGGKVGDIVESVVFTKDLQKALGIDLGKVGWLIKVKVSDPAIWKRVKSGELKAFSIGGYGQRVPM